MPAQRHAIEPGAVRLNVGDAGRAEAFYAQTIGLHRVGEPEPEVTRLGANQSALVELVEAPGAPRRPPNTTGLFHLAILLESRAELARAMNRVLQSGWSLGGASDHLVSEALYLSDPEGNGIELYRDRPRAEWRHVDGRLQMSSLPLDLDALGAEAGGDPGSGGVGSGARIGHLHLNVADLERTEAFYCGLLGFEVTVRGYPGALFVSTGGYHHHLGFNTWAGPGAPSPPAGALGLNRFELVVDSQAPLDRVAARLAEAGVEAYSDEGVQVADPSGIRLLLRHPRPRG
jgi:catechol 2,3-dioxygenase